MTDAWHYQTVVELAERIRAKAISPVEITDAILDRIEALDGSAKSYATLMADSARASAKKAETEILAGDYKGPLHGIPIAVKDLCFTKGVRTMGGCKVLADHVPEFDATVVRRLADAGTVLLGKLNLTEGAMGGYNPEFDIPLNPWNVDRWSGSSSSGSGVATALGMCFGSLGSDTGGSIRFPSAACGIVGLKPTWGRVSRYGVLALAESLDHVGPMTRSVADAALMLQAIAGRDDFDPTSLARAVPDMLDGIFDGVAGVRIGVDEGFATTGVDAELADSFRAALKVLADLGADIVEIDMPDVDSYLPAWPVLCSAEAVAAHHEFYPARRGDYGPWFRDWLDMGAEVTGANYAEAHKMRVECNNLIANAVSAVDLLACPSMMGPPFEVTAESNYGPRDDRRGTSFQRFTAPFDFSGVPTLSMPCGFSSDGLPHSLQLVGTHLDEEKMCRAGLAFEQATEWHLRHPPEPTPSDAD